MLSREAYPSEPPTPTSRAANRSLQEKEKAWKDAETERKARRNARREAHRRECQRCEREGLSPPASPENSESDDSGDDRETPVMAEKGAPSTSTAGSTGVLAEPMTSTAQVRATAVSAAAAVPLDEGVPSRVAPDSGRAQPPNPRKRKWEMPLKR